MKKLLSLLFCMAFTLSSCTFASVQPALEFPKIEHYPAALNFTRGALDELAPYQADGTYEQRMLTPDLRSYDLSKLDLSGSFEYLLMAMFDDRTTWPRTSQMPANLDIQNIMEYGKNPGLGIRQLHANGYTGKGVGIAIIDQPLLIDHVEYVNQLRLYEELDDLIGGKSSMHGPAVASIAVGKTVGVAPDADLYFIASDFGNNLDFHLTQGINRILEINEQLPADRKIRVITMEIGWQPDSQGYDELMAAIERARAENIFVISSSLETYTPFKFHGLGRSSLDDPECFKSYLPGFFWADRFYGDKQTTGRLLIPMDSRTLASPTGIDEYVFYPQGGWSWAIPYIAGVYALAVQADPEITPDLFWEIAMRTGTYTTVEQKGNSYVLGPIIDPVAIIAELEN